MTLRCFHFTRKRKFQLEPHMLLCWKIRPQKTGDRQLKAYDRVPSYPGNPIKRRKQTTSLLLTYTLQIQRQLAEREKKREKCGKERFAFWPGQLSIRLCRLAITLRSEPKNCQSLRERKKVRFLFFFVSLVKLQLYQQSYVLMLSAGGSSSSRSSSSSISVCYQEKEKSLQKESLVVGSNILYVRTM